MYSLSQFQWYAYLGSQETIHWQWSTDGIFTVSNNPDFQDFSNFYILFHLFEWHLVQLHTHILKCCLCYINIDNVAFDSIGFPWSNILFSNILLQVSSLPSISRLTCRDTKDTVTCDTFSDCRVDKNETQVTDISDTRRHESVTQVGLDILMSC